MEKEILLKVENINKSFVVDNVEQKALDNISFEERKGEFVCIIGPSGCGKSTLLRIISGLLPYNSGKIIKKDNLKFSFVFQNFALFPWLTVEQNVGFGLKMADVNKSKIDKTVAEYLKDMSLTDFREKHPKELSGGMKQRVGIARALTQSPDILLLDEPFSALDALTATKLRNDLLQIWQDKNLSIIMVSHLIEEAIQLADKVIVFSANPGKIIKVVEIKLPRPRDLRSKEFFEYYDLLSSEIEEQ
jgi:NitT/TauT family transport system ATP-binding protein